MSQKLRGLVAQNMDGRKAHAVFAPGAGPTFTFPAGTYTFVAPTSGRWLFVGWGAGAVASGSSSGGSGGYFEITRFLAKGQTVSIAVSAVFTALAATSVVLPTGVTATAGSANTSTGGTAAGGDVNINGSAGVSGTSQGNPGGGTGGGPGGVGGSSFGGAGAPANLPFRGAPGGNSDLSANNGFGSSPGGGSTSTIAAGAGLVLAVYIAPKG